MTSIQQTVNISNLAGLLNTHAYVNLIYGGDAFAAAHASGSGQFGLFHAGAGYQAAYTVEFLGSAGTVLASDTSGFVFPTNSFCLSLNHKEQKYGYRRTVAAIPVATRFIRFTATLTDTLSICYGAATATFRNGFDKLWLDVAFLSDPHVLGRQFKAGDPPGASVDAVPARKR